MAHTKFDLELMVAEGCQDLPRFRKTGIQQSYQQPELPAPRYGLTAKETLRRSLFFSFALSVDRASSDLTSSILSLSDCNSRMYSYLQAASASSSGDKSKNADLVLVEGDASERLSDLRQTRVVILDGKLMDADALRTAAGFSGLPK
jgi:hypothetical protein